MTDTTRTMGTMGTTESMASMASTERTGPTESMEAAGRWFDGRYNVPLPVHARLTRGRLELRRDAGDDAPLRHYAADTLSAGEVWRDAPTPVQLPDGGTLWIEAGAALAGALGKKGFATRLISSWPKVAATLTALIALVVWFDRQGAGLAAGALLPLVPPRVDQSIGDVAEQQVMRTWITDSEVDEDRQDQIDERFHAMARKSFPGLKLKLVFGRMAGQGEPDEREESSGADDEAAARRSGGVNAFALPNGTIVLLDGLTNQLSDDQLIAVLAHEAGHVKHRHATRGLLQGAGLLAVSGVVLGDYSSAVSTMLGTVQTLRYQREAERQSDAEAQRVLREEGLPADTLVQVWTLLASNQPAIASEVPAWLSTHPDTQERIESAKRAQAAGN